jgi:hypothetical protein
MRLTGRQQYAVDGLWMSGVGQCARLHSKYAHKVSFFSGVYSEPSVSHVRINNGIHLCIYDLYHCAIWM